MGRVVTQGDPAFPIIFNIMVDTLVLAVLGVIFRPQEAQHGLEWVAGERNLIFYAVNGRIVGWYHEWLQDSLTGTVAVVCRLGLETNLKKTNFMVCMPGFIWGKWGDKAYKRKEKG